jgi:hypothetical protein
MLQTKKTVEYRQTLNMMLPQVEDLKEEIKKTQMTTKMAN